MIITLLVPMISRGRRDGSFILFVTPAALYRQWKVVVV